MMIKKLQRVRRVKVENHDIAIGSHSIGSAFEYKSCVA